METFYLLMLNIAIKSVKQEVTLEAKNEPSLIALQS